LTLAGLAGDLSLLKLGAIFTMTGWSLGTLILVALVHADEGRTWHAVSCTFALVFGLLGLVLYTIFLYRFDARLMFVSIKLASIAVLLPIFFTVCHRMLPFFAGAVIPGYRAARPMWALAAFWGLALTHLAGATPRLRLALDHRCTLAALCAWILALVAASEADPALLRVLFVGFAWLPAAFALYAAQSLIFAMTNEFVLGRAPAHALFIGFFGSLLVAMVTRVTQGHSGRPLVLGRVAAVAFILVQLVAVLRILAEVVPDALAWQAIAAVGWVIAFLPWVLRSAWIYLTPPPMAGGLTLSVLSASNGCTWPRSRGRALIAFRRLQRSLVIAPLRYLSYTRSTRCCSAAFIARSASISFVHGWLTVKSLARATSYSSSYAQAGRTQAVRIACWLAAIAVLDDHQRCRAHHPLRLLVGVRSSCIRSPD
jgi:uncharacterized protein involved in response to NO